MRLATNLLHRFPAQTHLYLSFTNDNITIAGVNIGTATANQLVPMLFRFADGTYNGNSLITALRESATGEQQSFIFAPANSSGDPTERMRITNGGNVLIGSATATGTASQPLQVTGGAYVSGNLGIGTTNPTAKLYLQGNAAANIVALGNTNATTTLDFTQGNNFSLTLTGSITLANPTGVTTGQSGLLLIQEDGTGGYTCAWGTSWDFASSTAPTLTTTASALNALPYFARSTTSIVVGSVIAGIGTL
jgi:hypothetical protein